MGRAHPIEQARRRSYEEGERQVSRIQLEGARAQLQQNIARSRYQVDVIDEDDNGSIVPSALINEATHRRPELSIARPGGTAQAGICNPWGSKTPIRDQRPYDRLMFSLLYLAIRVLARLIVTGGDGGRDDGAKDLEILVLRQQLRVLRRTSGPPRYRAIDRVLLAAASRSIPSNRWVTSLAIVALVEVILLLR